MKKGLALLFVLMLCLSLAACDGVSGHKCSGDWITLKEATCLKEGSQQLTCTSCSKVTTKAIPKLSHSYENNICTLCNTADPNYKPAASKGLWFESNGDGTCGVYGLDRDADPEVVIPEMSPQGEKVIFVLGSGFSGQDITSLWIPDSVTHIGMETFAYCRELTTVVIGNGVKEISEGAFSNCNKLTTVSLGSSLTKVGEEAFYGCTALSKITLPETLTELGAGAFQYSGLTEITLPDSFAMLNDYTFAGSRALQRINIGRGLRAVYPYAFQDCPQLKGIYMDDITTWCNLYFQYLDDNPTSKGCQLYVNGQLLTDLVVPEGVTQLRNFMGYTSLVSVTAPSTIRFIRRSAFQDCTNLTTVKLSNGLTEIDSYAFENCSKLSEFTIPESITSIYFTAFAGCTGLKKVTINSARVMRYVFQDSTALEEVIVPSALISKYRANESWSDYTHLLKCEEDNVTSATSHVG